MQIHKTSSVELDGTHLVFNAILPHSLKISASILNSGNYEALSDTFVYRIEAISDRCTWQVTNANVAHLLNVNSLQPHSTTDVSKMIRFNVDECACAKTFDRLSITLRFELFPITGLNPDATAYVSSSYDVMVKIDCSHFPFLPALAFYVRPYVLDVFQWCADNAPIAQCVDSNSPVLDLDISAELFIYSTTHLSLGQVNKPPDQLNSVELSSFPLPFHDFYLIPSKEGVHQSQQIQMQAVNENNKVQKWSQSDGIFE